jgi:hypothetical protein
MKMYSASQKRVVLGIISAVCFVSIWLGWIVLFLGLAIVQIIPWSFVANYIKQLPYMSVVLIPYILPFLALLFFFWWQRPFRIGIFIGVIFGISVSICSMAMQYFLDYLDGGNPVLRTRDFNKTFFVFPIWGTMFGIVFGFISRFISVPSLAHTENRSS